VELPIPATSELQELVRNAVTREIYRVLYEHRGQPLNIHQIRDLIVIGPDAGVQQHLDRRLRELDQHFLINRGMADGKTAYTLVERLDAPRRAPGSVPKQLRALVLRDQRCAQCGRTPGEDRVKLHVDHKIPQRWGGDNSPENLQALCSECNEGKRDHYATFNNQEPAILKAFTYDEPHVRIGEALKAAYPKELRGDLLERVASAKQYQEDWQKRLRELRLLGWKIEASRRGEQGRTVAYYRLLDPAPPWPSGSVRAAIRAVERGRGY